MKLNRAQYDTCTHIHTSIGNEGHQDSIFHLYPKPYSWTPVVAHSGSKVPTQSGWSANLWAMPVKEDWLTTAFFKASTFYILGDGTIGTGTLVYRLKPNARLS
jgi:hypothetical protein